MPGELRLVLLTAALLAAFPLIAEGQTSGAPGDGRTDRRIPASGDEEKAHVSAEDTVQSAFSLLDRFEATSDRAARVSLMKQIDAQIDTLRAQDPDNPWFGLILGRALVATGRPRDAIEELRKFIETRDGRNHWQAHSLLGDLFVEEFPQLAKAHYSQAMKLKPGESSIVLGLSLCSSKLGDVPGAIELAREADEATGRDNSRYAAHLARLLMRGRKWREADRAARRALRLDQEARRIAPHERAVVLAVLDRCNLLIELGEAQLREQPDQPELYLQLASYIEERADVAAHLALFDQLDVLALGIEQTAPNAPSQLLQKYAEVLTAVGRTDDAIAALEQALEKDPQDLAAAKALAHLREEHTTPTVP